MSANTICQAACAKVLRGRLGRRPRFVAALPAQFAPHLPGDPQQQDAAGEQQADDRQQFDRDRGERDAQQRRRPDADQNGALAPLGRQAGGGEPDDDRVVARQHQVDHDDLQEGGDRGLCEEVVHRVSLAPSARFDTRAAYS